MGEAWYREQGIEIVDVDRGGQLTYHGPGQLVGYPIMRDRRRAWATCGRWSARSSPRWPTRASTARARPADGPEYTGVWVGERKIASIGVHVAHGRHDARLRRQRRQRPAPFGWVVACGLPGVRDDVGARELGSTGARMPCFRKRMAYRFAQAFGRRQRLVSATRLQQAIAAAPVPV